VGTGFETLQAVDSQRFTTPLGGFQTLQVANYQRFTTSLGGFFNTGIDIIFQTFIEPTFPSPK
jgi:hypothetical protein